MIKILDLAHTRATFPGAPRKINQLLLHTPPPCIPRAYIICSMRARAIRVKIPKALLRSVFIFSRLALFPRSSIVLPRARIHQKVVRAISYENSRGKSC